ncbi:MAG TPA: response regulator transcription factor [Acidimicrobiia bacterium]|nr:response regulator transcription factor [Acidimicrobiia bacterium]
MPSEREHRAVVADDVALLRLGIAAVLEPLGFDIVAESSLGRPVPKLAEDGAVDLVVLGAVADLPLAEIVKRCKQVPEPPLVLVLVPRTHRDELGALLSYDANGLVVRNLPTEELALSVERVMKGERVVAPALLSTLVGAMGPVNDEAVDESSLTVREREVLALLAEGQSNREIASSLYVSLPTVKTHLAHIYAKLGAKNRNEALGRAVALGLLG